MGRNLMKVLLFRKMERRILLFMKSIILSIALYSNTLIDIPAHSTLINLLIYCTL